MLAGLVATIALSAVLLMKASMGIMPQMDVIQMLGNMVGGGSRMVGWIIHFVIGTILWGLLFTALFGAADRLLWWRGSVFYAAIRLAVEVTGLWRAVRLSDVKFIGLRQESNEDHLRAQNLQRVWLRP